MNMVREGDLLVLSDEKSQDIEVFELRPKGKTSAELCGHRFNLSELHSPHW